MNSLSKSENIENSLSEGRSFFNISGLITGISLLLMFFVYQKGYTKIMGKHSEYSSIFKLLFIYPAFILYLLSESYLGNMALSFSLVSLYLYLLLAFKSRIFVLGNSYQFIYLLFRVFLVVIIFLSYYITGPDQDNFFINLIAFLLPVSLFVSTVYFDRRLYRVIHGISGKGVRSIKVFDVHLSHILIFAAYFIIATHITNNFFSPLHTILYIIHTVVILFMTLNKKYTYLMKAAIVFSLVTGIKLFFHDLKDFSMFEKMIVFCVTGVLLLGAAYLFQILKKRYG